MIRNTAKGSSSQCFWLRATSSPGTSGIALHTQYLMSKPEQHLARVDGASLMGSASTRTCTDAVMRKVPSKE